MNHYDPPTNSEMFEDFVSELLAFDDDADYDFANINELGLVVPESDLDQVQWENSSYNYVPDDAA